MKIFIINMKKDKNRKEYMLNQLKRYSFDYEFIQAVEGRTLSNQEIESQCEYDVFKKHPTWNDRGYGIIGCSLSHKMIYERIVREKIPRALILEDDVFLEAEFDLVLDQLDNPHLPLDDAELVLLCTMSCDEKVKLSNKNIRRLCNGYALYHPINHDNIWLTSSYLISYESAKRFIKAYPKISRVADAWGGFYDKGIFSTISVLYPFVTNTGDIDSTIGVRLPVQSKKSLKRLINFISPKLLSWLVNLNQKRYMYFKQGVVKSSSYSPVDMKKQG